MPVEDSTMRGLMGWNILPKAMASASIKVEGDTKRLLDELQAELTQQVGRKVTLQEVTKVVAELAAQDRERLLAAFVDRPRKLTKAQVDRLLSLRVDAPFHLEPEEMDDLIYGFPHGPDEPVTPGARRLHRRIRSAKARTSPSRKRRGRRT